MTTTDLRVWGSAPGGGITRPGLVTRAASAVGRGLKQLTIRFSRTTGYGWALLFGRTRYDYVAAVGDGTRNSAVAACLSWIGRTFPEAPVRVLKPKGSEYEAIPGHPMVELIERPNPYYSGPVLWAATMLSYHAEGDAYWVKARSGAGRPVQLWWIPHTLMTPKSDNDTDFIQYYEYRPGGTPIKLDPSEVVHFRNGLDPSNPRKGSAPLKAALREVFADDEAANFFGALMRNMGIPGVLIAPDTEHVNLQQEDADAIKADFETKFGGDNRGRPMVLPAKTKVEKLAFSPEELDLRQLRRLPEERISAVLGVPAIVAGLGAGLDRSTFANYAEAREAAWEDCILPTQRIIAADLKAQLLPDFDDAAGKRVDFDISGVRVLQPDQNALYTRTLDALLKGAVRLDEARRQLGQETKPEHEVWYIPNTVTVRATVLPAEPEPEPAPPQLTPPSDEDLEALLAGSRNGATAA